MSRNGTRLRRLGRPPVHGMRGRKEYSAWLALRAACDNPRHPRYSTTGGAGVSYPSKWETFEGFFEDMGDAPKGTSLKRKDTSKNYDANNCDWA